MSVYKTKQREQIISIFKNHSLDVLSAFDVKKYAAESRYKIGLTTIYRNLSDLCDRGYLKKYIKANGEAEYGLLDNQCMSHFHLKCKNCGCVIHMSCDEVSKIYDHVSLHHDFIIDYKDTTIMGVCGKCAKGCVNNEKNI